MIDKILTNWIRREVDNSVYEFRIQRPSIMIGEFLCRGEAIPFADDEIWLSWGCLNIPFINKEINYDKLYDHIEKTIQPEGDEALREISRPISNKKDIFFTFGEDVTPAMIINYIMFNRSNKMFIEQGLKVRKNIFGFFLYSIFYGIVLQPVCVIGYIKEIFNRRKSW